MDLPQTLNLGSDNYVSDAAYVFMGYLDNTSLLMLGLTCRDNYMVFSEYFAPGNDEIIGSLRNWASYNRMGTLVDNIGVSVNTIIDIGSLITFDLSTDTVIRADKLMYNRVIGMRSMETAEILTSIGCNKDELIFANTITCIIRDADVMPDIYDKLPMIKLMKQIGTVNSNRYLMSDMPTIYQLPYCQRAAVTDYVLSKSDQPLYMSISHRLDAIEILYGNPVLPRLLSRIDASNVVLESIDDMINEYVLHTSINYIGIDVCQRIAHKYPHLLNRLFEYDSEISEQKRDKLIQRLQYYMHIKELYEILKDRQDIAVWLYNLMSIECSEVDTHHEYVKHAII